MASTIVIGLTIFLAGFVAGAYVEDNSRKMREAKNNTGHLANINTALWSIMNNGIKVRQVKKKKKSPARKYWEKNIGNPDAHSAALINHIEDQRKIRIGDSLPKMPKLRVELDLMKRAGFWRTRE